jgi:hypothetical protein
MILLEQKMITAAAIRARSQQTPFVPFRIVTSSGRAYDVPHPELILVGMREVTIGRSSSHNPAFYVEVDRVSILHVTALEDLGSSPAPNRDSEAQPAADQ